MSDSEEELWQDADDDYEFWQEASQHPSVNNTPVKESTKNPSDAPLTPSGRATQAMESLRLNSGGTGEWISFSSLRETHPSRSQSKDDLQSPLHQQTGLPADGHRWEMDSDVEDEMEVTDMVATDDESESFSLILTRENSLAFPSPTTTSTTSMWSEISPGSTSGGTKRSLEHTDVAPSLLSTPSSPSKVRRTVSSPQASSDTGPRSIGRSATYPIASSQRTYPTIIDEESVFRPSTSVPCEATPPQAMASSAPQINPENQAQIESDVSYDILNRIREAKKIFIIAHNRDVQKQMDSLGLAYGVQYELARGVSREAWQWEDLTYDKLVRLQGSNAIAAPLVTKVVLGSDRSSTKIANKEHWRELDREQKALLEGKGRGLGLMGDWEGRPNWYGGQVQQVARVDATSGEWRIIIEPMEQRSSCEFSRFLTSKGLLQVRVPEKLMYGEASIKAREFFSQKFILCGRCFMAFSAKEGKVYMMETNEDFERQSNDRYGDGMRMSFASFVEWFNPLHLNSDQTITKWVARFALGLSTSVPVLEFAPENIHYIDDIYAPHDDSDGPVPSEKIMTDGAGFMNGAALTQICERMGYPARPDAVQGRIGGDKGMWMLLYKAADLDEAPKIWTRRQSQRKIRHLPISDPSQPANRAHLIFNLLSPSKARPECCLAMHAIINLSHNGVPDEVFMSLLEKGLDADVRALTQWTEPLILVAKTIHNSGGLTGARLQRLAQGTSRAHGFISDFARDKNTADAHKSSGRKPFSGEPISLHEVAYEMLQSGFDPKQSKILSEKIRRILTLQIDDYVKRFKIPVPESVYAFILPDPARVLKEDEIFFQSSQSLVDPQSGSIYHTVSGRDVILGRNPIRLSSDLRRVKAVAYPELSKYHDVIIVSTKGERSLPSWLAGGDMDGDRVFMVWHGDIVQNFTNPPFVPAPSKFEEDHFEPTKESVDRFVARAGQLEPDDLQSEVSSTMLLGLFDARVGQYSILHDNATYVLGYDHPTTVRLAYLVNTLLDSSRTGLRLLPHCASRDMGMFHGKRVKSMVGGEERNSQTNIPDLTESDRAPANRSRPFVLDNLIKFGETLVTKRLEELEEQFMDARSRKDVDQHVLLSYQLASSKAHTLNTLTNPSDRLQTELQAIKAHVTASHAEYRKACDLSKSPSKKKDRQSAEGEGDSFGEAARFYAEGPQSVDDSGFITSGIDEIKASYAYSLSAPFAFSVAFKDVCAIKAKACQDMPITRDFAEALTILPAFVRALGHSEADYA